MPKVALICDTCGATYYRWPSQARLGNGQFCSRKCVRGYKISKTVEVKRPPIDNGDGTFAIPLTRGKMAIIDAEDLPAVEVYNWTATPSGQTFYATRAAAGGGTVIMHRQILGAKRGESVDHKDGDGLNNRRSNIRICTQEENARNRRPGKSTTGYKGVYPTTSGKYIARISSNNQQVNLGTYPTVDEAVTAYNQAATELHGEFARPN